MFAASFKENILKNKHKFFFHDFLKIIRAPMNLHFSIKACEDPMGKIGF
jgi:hypothetical protein